MSTTVFASAPFANIVFPVPFSSGAPRHAPLRRAARMIGDGLALAALVVSVPFIILAIGTPLALGIRAVLWLAGAAR